MQARSFTRLEVQLRGKLEELDKVSLMTRDQEGRLIYMVLSSNSWLQATLEDPTWQQSIRLASVPVSSEEHEKVTPEVAQRIQPGDVINVSYFSIPHKVVVEDCDYDELKGVLTVQGIHYGRQSLLQPVTIMREKFVKSCDSSSTWLHRFPNSVLYTHKESLVRAQSRLGERQQHPITNNAHCFALWCRVRDPHRNKEEIRIPIMEDSGQFLHQLKPNDHVNMLLLNKQCHTVLSAIEPINDTEYIKLFSAAMLTADLVELVANGLRSFYRGTYVCSPSDQAERVQVPYHINSVRQNAEKFIGASLTWECNELEALAFLATGVATHPRQCLHFPVTTAEILPGSVIYYRSQIHFVLALHRPVPPSTTLTFESLQYSPTQFDQAAETNELRLLVDLRNYRQMKVVCHNEPDMQCPVLMNWKHADLPLITETPVTHLETLKPGEAVCVREDTSAYPLSSKIPGLHGIVSQVYIGMEPSVELICYTRSCSDPTPIVSVRHLSANGHSFSRLVYDVPPERLTSKEEALKRALARINTGQYCSSWSNSRDLTRWCCINHKSNASTFLGSVKSLSDLITLPDFGQGLLWLQQLDEFNSPRLRDVQLVRAEPFSGCVDLAKLTFLGASWRASRVRHVEFAKAARLQVSRVLRSQSNEAQSELLNVTVEALLGASLINASDCRLGAGVTDAKFCTWMAGLTGKGITELPGLLSSNTAARWSELLEAAFSERVPDLGSLSAWDHVIVKLSSDKPPVHILVSSYDAESGTLRGCTYGPDSEDHDPSQHLEVFAYFPLEKSPYPIQKVIRQSGSTLSQLSSSLSAASNFPYDAAAWVHAAAVELQSGLLIERSSLSSLLSSMLSFALRVAAREVRQDNAMVLACRMVLASEEFALEMRRSTDLISEVCGRRLYFAVQLIEALIANRAD